MAYSIWVDGFPNFLQVGYVRKSWRLSNNGNILKPGLSPPFPKVKIAIGFFPPSTRSENFHLNSLGVR